MRLTSLKMQIVRVLLDTGETLGNTWQSVGFKRVLSLSVIFSNTIEGC